MTKPPSANELIATGKAIVRRDPLYVLRELRAAIRYSSATGYTINLGAKHEDYLFRTLIECIAFHEGYDDSPHGSKR